MNRIKVPSGSEAFVDAVERLRNLPPRCTNVSDFALYCCRLCTNPDKLDCEDCYVGVLTDCQDNFRDKMQTRSKTGVYSSGMYRDKDGNYQYTHPQGSG